MNASDEVNALLNYGYAILESEVRKRINAVGLVDKADFHRIVHRVGYDVRGPGGFFRGSRPSLQETPDGRVFITKEASRDVERWTGQTMEEYAKNFS